MPFFDDSGPRPEEERGPIRRSFALAKDQLERLILVNLLWSAQCLPLMLGWAIEMPAGLRLVLTLYTALALAIATGVLFALVAEVSEGTPIEWSVISSSLKEQWKPGLLKLLPLYSLFYWLGLGAWYFASRNWLIPDTLVRLLFLLLLVLSLTWGGLLVYQPKLSAAGMLRESARLFGRSPAQALLVGLACLMAVLLGAASIAGFFLIVPVLVALFQIELYRFIRKG